MLAPALLVCLNVADLAEMVLPVWFARQSIIVVAPHKQMVKCPLHL